MVSEPKQYRDEEAGATRSFPSYKEFFESSAQAQSAEMYVLHYGSDVLAGSTDVEALKALVKKRMEANGVPMPPAIQWDGGGVADRLRMTYISPHTKRWNASEYYITKVPVLEGEHCWKCVHPWEDHAEDGCQAQITLNGDPYDCNCQEKMK